MTHSKVEHGRVNVGGLGIVHRVGRSRQDDSLGFEREGRNLLRAGEHLGVHLVLAQAASNKVTVLRTVEQSNVSGRKQKTQMVRMTYPKSST
jgi:flagellar basal body rod protein FlgG